MDGGNVNEAKLKSLTYEYAHAGYVGFTDATERHQWENFQAQKATRAAELLPRIADLTCACGAKYPEPHRTTGGANG
jgi:hypothetical protein